MSPWLNQQPLLITLAFAVASIGKRPGIAAVAAEWPIPNAMGFSLLVFDVCFSLS
jgi:hypothetical protein